MTIGVVIVTHNSKEHIRECVQSVQREGMKNIVVVDSASTDSTLGILATLNVQTISLPQNKGFGYAANRGAERMNTDYVLFINPDAYVEIGALQNVQDLLGRVQAVGIVGMMLQSANHIPEKESFGEEPFLTRLLFRKLIRKSVPQAPCRVDWVSGGAMVVDRSTFTRLKGFDEGFFLYWEDVDLCRRVRNAGYSIWMHPHAKASHVRGGSQKDIKLKTRIYDASADRYYKKHYPTHIWLLQRILRKLYRTVSPEAH